MLMVVMGGVMLWDSCDVINIILDLNVLYFVLIKIMDYVMIMEI